VAWLNFGVAQFATASEKVADRSPDEPNDEAANEAYPKAKAPFP
jgi:hypothetical protein